jgi:hypothetical protein
MSDFLETMEQSSVADAARSAPQPLRAAGPTDWFQFRRKHPDLGIAKTGEDGSLEDWQSLLREVGQDKLTTALIKARSTGRKGDRIWLARALEALGVDSSHNSPDEKKTDVQGAKRSRVALLVWCICHSAKCYADAISPWTPVEGDSVSVRLPMIGRVKRTPLQDPHTPERRAKLEAMAKAARTELLTQCGFPDDARWNGRLSDTVMATPHLVAWLRSQRLVP